MVKEIIKVLRYPMGIRQMSKTVKKTGTKGISTRNFYTILRIQ